MKQQVTGWDQAVMRSQVKVAHGLLRFASPDIWESDIPPRVEGHEGGWGGVGGGVGGSPAVLQETKCRCKWSHKPE